jgi:hypothetical protein
METHSRSISGIVLLLFAPVCLAMPTAGLAIPGELVVNATTDWADAEPGDGMCATARNRCTVRAAT